jgi:hypothetical protein
MKIFEVIQNANAFVLKMKGVQTEPALLFFQRQLGRWDLIYCFSNYSLEVAQAKEVIDPNRYLVCVDNQTGEVTADETPESINNRCQIAMSISEVIRKANEFVLEKRGVIAEPDGIGLRRKRRSKFGVWHLMYHFSHFYPEEARDGEGVDGGEYLVNVDESNGEVTAGFVP